MDWKLFLEEAIEKILSSAQVTEKEFSFNELMKK